MHDLQEEEKPVFQINLIHVPIHLK